MHRIYLSLGSNMGDKMANLEEAIMMLGKKIRIIARSSFYETEPVGYLDQDQFLNLVLEGETELTADALLDFIHAVENDMKRVRVIRYGPRVIDVDILLYDELALDSETLTLPHPRMLERAFVMVPLYEIAPALEVSGFKIADLPISHATDGIRKLP